MSATVPRGVRLFNPGNLRLGIAWDGLALIQTDAEFCQFVSPEYGIRAMAVLLRNYQTMHDLHTVREIINRYAPASENNTDSYVADVCQRMGVLPDAWIDVTVWATMLGLVTAIIAHECDDYGYPPDTLAQGLTMANIAAPVTV